MAVGATIAKVVASLAQNKEGRKVLKVVLGIIAGALILVIGVFFVIASALSQGPLLLLDWVFGGASVPPPEDAQQAITEMQANLTMLEEVIRIFSHTASHRIFGVQGTVAEFLKSFLIDQRSKIFIFQHFYFLYLMRSTESVKEVNKRKFSFKRCAMSNRCQVHNFLYAGFTEHCASSLTTGVNI